MFLCLRQETVAHSESRYSPPPAACGWLQDGFEEGQVLRVLTLEDLKGKTEAYLKRLRAFFHDDWRRYRE
jgi:hypothetical protein